MAGWEANPPTWLDAEGAVATDESNAGIERVTVTFVRDFPPYRRSDVATLEVADAEDVIRRGVAKRYKDGAKVPKELVHQQWVGGKSVRTGAL
jgi:hypothetical protein